MSLLSDFDIEKALEVGRIRIDPFDRALLQPASVDVLLGDTFAVFSEQVTHVDPRESPMMRSHRVTDGQAFVLHPGAFALGHTVERITVGEHYAARIEGKSSIGRLGALVHATAGFIDPGFTDGQITLELANVSPLPIKLWPGMKIAQLCFFDLSSRSRKPYGEERGSNYQGQRGPTPSRSFAQFQTV